MQPHLALSHLAALRTLEAGGAEGNPVRGAPRPLQRAPLSLLIKASRRQAGNRRRHRVRRVASLGSQVPCLCLPVQTGPGIAKARSALVFIDRPFLL